MRTNIPFMFWATRQIWPHASHVPKAGPVALCHNIFCIGPTYLIKLL